MFRFQLSCDTCSIHHLVPHYYAVAQLLQSIDPYQFTFQFSLGCGHMFFIIFADFITKRN